MNGMTEDKNTPASANGGCLGIAKEYTELANEQKDTLLMKKDTFSGDSRLLIVVFLFRAFLALLSGETLLELKIFYR